MQSFIDHCVPGNVKELEMDNSNTRSISMDKGWLEQARPIFHQLEKLSLKNRQALGELSYRRNWNQLKPIFIFYRRDMPNLKSLTLKNVSFGTESWLSVFPIELANIEELHLIDVTLKEKLNEFQMFLSQLTNLQVFVHLRHNENNPQPESIANCLYQRFPQLKGFGCNIGQDERQARPKPYPMGDSFKFLEKFTNMTDIYVAFGGSSIPQDIHKILQFVPNISVFSIARIGRFGPMLWQPPAAVRFIVKTIKEVIERRNNGCSRNSRIKVIVNAEQYREFIVVKNVHKIIRLSIA